MDEVRAANQARLQYLLSHGVNVPMDLLYATSLLEYLLGPNLDAAHEYHERRVAPMLDNAVSALTVAEEKNRSAQARATLLNGITPRMN